MKVKSQREKGKRKKVKTKFNRKDPSNFLTINFSYNFFIFNFIKE